ncbi:hypothetical protein DXG03_005865 [Asterophora parasitica]|uniref:Uncharacterized protein n=1 Tax=Asterophora parasitica TaxID=117018 RepID=A0A9P7G005_9AGAR|nr:hypothetical protein DXG03_005865 [Asterophora parasitica]
MTVVRRNLTAPYQTLPSVRLSILRIAFRRVHFEIARELPRKAYPKTFGPVSTQSSNRSKAGSSVDQTPESWNLEEGSCLLAEERSNLLGSNPRSELESFVSRLLPLDHQLMPSSNSHSSAPPSNPAPLFSEVKFSTIGQQPQLLKRFSTPGLDYQPESQSSPTPSHFELQYPSPSHTPPASARPSLLQLIGDRPDPQNFFIPMDPADPMAIERNPSIHSDRATASSSSGMTSMSISDRSENSRLPDPSQAPMDIDPPISTTPQQNLHTSSFHSVQPQTATAVIRSGPPSLTSRHHHKNSTTSTNIPIGALPPNIPASPQHLLHSALELTYQSTSRALDLAGRNLASAQEAFDAARKSFAAAHNALQAHSAVSRQTAPMAGTSASAPSLALSSYAREGPGNPTAHHSATPSATQMRTSSLSFAFADALATKLRSLTELEREADAVRQAWSSAHAEQVLAQQAVGDRGGIEPTPLADEGRQPGSNGSKSTTMINGRNGFIPPLQTNHSEPPASNVPSPRSPSQDGRCNREGPREHDADVNEAQHNVGMTPSNPPSNTTVVANPIPTNNDTLSARRSRAPSSHASEYPLMSPPSPTIPPNLSREPSAKVDSHSASPGTSSEDTAGGPVNEGDKERLGPDIKQEEEGGWGKARSSSSAIPGNARISHHIKLKVEVKKEPEDDGLERGLSARSRSGPSHPQSVGPPDSASVPSKSPVDTGTAVVAVNGRHEIHTTPVEDSRVAPQNVVQGVDKDSSSANVGNAHVPPRGIVEGLVDEPRQQPTITRPATVEVPRQQPTLTRPATVAAPRHQPILTRPATVEVPRQQVTLTRPAQQPTITRPATFEVPRQQPFPTKPAEGDYRSLHQRLSDPVDQHISSVANEHISDPADDAPSLLRRMRTPPALTIDTTTPTGSQPYEPRSGDALQKSSAVVLGKRPCPEDASPLNSPVATSVPKRRLISSSSYRPNPMAESRPESGPPRSFSRPQSQYQSPRPPGGDSYRPPPPGPPQRNYDRYVSVPSGRHGTMPPPPQSWDRNTSPPAQRDRRTPPGAGKRLQLGTHRVASEGNYDSSSGPEQGGGPLRKNWDNTRGRRKPSLGSRLT